MKRIKKSQEEEVIDFKDMIGASVKITSGTMQNYGWKYSDNYNFNKQYHTISNIQFRVSLDGKCFSIVSLDGVNNARFSLKDLEFVSKKEEF